MDFEKYLYYDETSPSCLRWKVKLNRKIIVGSSAGTLCNGRWQIRLCGKLYLAHRVIYEMFFGDITGLEIDHCDRNPANNKILNLRAVEHSINMRNTSLQINNKSGVTGVNRKEIYDKRRDYTYLGWRAEWRDLDGKNCTKLFSIRKYGDEQAFQLACDYRNKMIQELNAQGAGYSSTHGK